MQPARWSVRPVILALLCAAFVCAPTVPALAQSNDSSPPQPSALQDPPNLLELIQQLTAGLGRAGQEILGLTKEHADEQEGNGRPRPLDDNPTVGMWRRYLKEDLERLQHAQRVLDNLRSNKADPDLAAGRVRATANTAWRTADRVLSLSAASDELKATATQAQERARLAELNAELYQTLGQLGDAASNGRPEDVERLATRTEELAGQIGSHPAARPEDQIAATSAEIAAGIARSRQAATDEADAAAEAEAGSRASDVAGERQEPAAIESAGGGGTENRAELGTAGGPTVAPGVPAVPGKSGAEPDHASGDADDGQQGKQAVQRPGGLASVGGWPVGQGDGQVVGDEGLVPPGGIVIAPGGVVGGKDEPTGTEGGSGAPAVVAVPAVAGWVGLTLPSGTGATQNQGFTIHKPDPSPNIFTDPKLPDLTERIIVDDPTPEPEGFGPPGDLPGTGISAGTGIGLGGGAGGVPPEILTPPTDLPGEPGQGGTFPLPDLHLPDYDAMGVG